MRWLPAREHPSELPPCDLDRVEQVLQAAEVMANVWLQDAQCPEQQDVVEHREQLGALNNETLDNLKVLPLDRGWSLLPSKIPNLWCATTGAATF